MYVEVRSPLAFAIYKLTESGAVGLEACFRIIYTFVASNTNVVEGLCRSEALGRPAK